MFFASAHCALVRLGGPSARNCDELSIANGRICASQGVTQDHREIGDAVPVHGGPAGDLPADLLRAVSRLPPLAQPETQRGLIDIGDRRTRIVFDSSRELHESSVPG